MEDTERKELILTVRELQEIEHSVVYATRWHHGTVGHNLLMLVATFALNQGFYLREDGGLYTPPHVKVVQEKR